MILRSAMAAVFALSVSAQAALGAAPAEFKDPGDKPEKMICRSTLETGSLVRKTKVCLTRKQWQESAERNQDYGRDLQETLRTRPCGDPPCTN